MLTDSDLDSEHGRDHLRAHFLRHGTPFSSRSATACARWPYPPKLQPITHETMALDQIVLRAAAGRTHRRELPMGKRGRKKRSRKGNAANHGKRPNA
ncbi:hypothetical protein GCM10011610_22260 [Nocardia rhizosphaerihabitans]|nr:hypothetical protein GCM10011610_22260 [Nocardia rhizosphaerihabitans]